MGTVRLLNIALFGHHGVRPAERDAGTRLDLDVEITFDSSRAEATDELRDTIDYTAVHTIVAEVVESDRHKLLEALGGRLAERLLAEFPAQGVVLRIRKGNLRLPGGHVEVEVVRGQCR